MSDAAAQGTPALPILMYHNIAHAPRDLRVYRSLFVSPAAFARQMWLLRRLGYSGLSMSAAMPYLRGERTGRIAVITLDDGYADNLDAALPILLRKKPDVLAITGDHSTPCVIKGHSWHPQPVLLQSAYSGNDKLERFSETGANLGSLGVFEAKYLIRYLQANAKMFDKYGA